MIELHLKFLVLSILFNQLQKGIKGGGCEKLSGDHAVAMDVGRGVISFIICSELVKPKIPAARYGK